MPVKIEDGEPPTATDTISIVLAAFAPLAGKRILDIGCGAGALAGSLSERGAHVTGVDPNEEAVAAARRAVPRATLYQAGAEALPLADGSFDGAIFLNSLHHVPEPTMHRALEEAVRVVEPAGPILVIEPLAEGSFFAALRPVEDETEIRTAARECLRRALESGVFERVDRAEYLRRDRFADLDEFLARVVAVDPARAVAAKERRPEIEAAFRRHTQLDADGSMILEQPMRAHILKASAQRSP